MQRAQGEILVSLAARTNPNDPCFCGATRKFRKCCGQMIDLNA
nr:SEC-C metal-binding domain-containing protein [Microvirga puerhi]